MKLKRFEGNPIVSPKPENDWEVAVTTNPAAWYDESTGEVKLIYRAAGNDDKHIVKLGLATSKDGYNFIRASDKPIIGPSSDGFDAGCMEDPRIIKMGEHYYITYASRPFPPGRYWEPSNKYAVPKCPDEFPVSLRGNFTASGLLITKDFKNFIRAGRITDPT